jgi:Cys-rich repeat protein
VQCLTSNDCAGTSTPICNDGGKCVQCTGDNTGCMAPNPWCQDTHCVQCRKDKDCPTGQTCQNFACK